MYLTGTSHKLELVLAGAVATTQLPVVVTWADHTSTTLTPGITSSISNSTTPVDITGSPAASTQRQINYLNVYNADTAAATVTISFHDGTNTRTLVKITLAIGEALIYQYQSGWETLTIGGKKVSSIYTTPRDFLKAQESLIGTVLAQNTQNSNTCYAAYLGRLEQAYTTANLIFRVTTAAATITWAEVGIAVGIASSIDDVALTTVGFTDTSAIVNSTGVKNVAVTMTGVQAGDHIYALIGAQATTALRTRSLTLADDINMRFDVVLAGTRPSTMAAGSVFAQSGAESVWYAVNLA